MRAIELRCIGRPIYSCRAWLAVAHQGDELVFRDEVFADEVMLLVTDQDIVLSVDA